MTPLFETIRSCGILPAVLSEVARACGASDALLTDALLTACGVGAVITRNATVAGAEGGCQAECGTAAAMAGAAAVVLAGGTPDMVDHCVAIALMNCMGLVCDPVAGLVQLPCSYRNASQAVNAVLSADLALAGQNSVIPADEVIAAMYKVGRQLPPELRETAGGGIAVTPTGKALHKELKKMGAKAQWEGRTATFEGVEELVGAPVIACDLRAGAAMVIAGLAAQGVTEVDSIHHIERGYEDIIEKLSGIGADIKVVEVPDPVVSANVAG